jgi:uncharacterized protein YndB with AHSA1/START domain
MTVDGRAAHEGTYERSVRIAAPRETVFAYFTDPEKMIRWMGTAVNLDARPGGVYRVDMNGRDIASGAYVEVDPPHRVVFTFGWERGGAPIPPGGSTVEVTLSPDGDGTVVHLVHRDLPEPTVPPHAEGWDHFLERLVIAGTGADPGPDPWAGTLETAPGD